MPKSMATLDDVITQIKITNRLLAVQLKGVESMKQQDLIGLLAGTGASNQDIADILNTSADVVRATLFRLKNKSIKNLTLSKDAQVESVMENDTGVNKDA